MNRRTERGYTLLEIIIALALGTLVVGLIGALFLFSFRTWQRGSDLRSVQIEATTIADLIARDIRVASQAGITLHPDVAVESGTPLLAVSVPAAEGSGGARWIVYTLDERQGELRRLLLERGEPPSVLETRRIASGVSVHLDPADGGVAVEVEVRRGGATFRIRRAAAPQNP